MNSNEPTGLGGETADRIMSSDDSNIAAPRAGNHPVWVRRMAREWTQAELARRAGVSRAAVSAIEGNRLSPSVSAALAIAAALGCSVEDLFGTGESFRSSKPEWAWSPRVLPGRYWEAEVFSRRWRYPVEAISLNPLPHDGVWQGDNEREINPAAAETTLTVASCDPAMGLLAAEYARASGFRMLVFPRGGLAALNLAQNRLLHVAALHRSTPDHPERNAEAARDQLGKGAWLLCAARWQAGIVLPSNESVHSLDAVIRRPRSWALREPGSAARECLEELLGGRTCAGRQVDSHFSVAEAVRVGWAEAGICVKLSAMEAGLSFLPLRTETLDFCFARELEGDPRIQALIRLLHSRPYRQLLGDLPGYDSHETGELRQA